MCEVRSKCSFISLFFLAISFMPYRSFCQWSIDNGLNCDFTITLTCDGNNSIYSLNTLIDSFQGNWTAHKTINLNNFKCLSKNITILIQSNRTNSNLSFSLNEYKEYISSGGDPNDFTNPNNHYIFCCCEMCDWRHPCGILNGCGAIIIDELNCKFTIQKPVSPFCP